MEGLHENYNLRPTGLWISPENPHIGATPDALSSCNCHGTGCVEVKCPFSIKDQRLSQAVKQGSSGLCLEQLSNGSVQLKRNHPYFAQVQTQLNVTGLDFAFFVVWTPQDMFIEKIDKDSEYFQQQLDKVTELYKSAVLPELLAKWYSKPRESSSSQQASLLFCYCREEDGASLVLSCSGTSCIFKKFHLKCCGLKRRPPLSRPWFCTDCRRLNTIPATNSVARHC